MLLQEPCITARANPTPTHKLWKPTFHDPDVACVLMWASSSSLSLSRGRWQQLPGRSVGQPFLAPTRPSTSLQRTRRIFSFNNYNQGTTTLFTSTFWNEETCYFLEYSNHFTICWCISMRLSHHSCSHTKWFRSQTKFSVTFFSMQLSKGRTPNSDHAANLSGAHYQRKKRKAESRSNYIQNEGNFTYNIVWAFMHQCSHHQDASYVKKLIVPNSGRRKKWAATLKARSCSTWLVTHDAPGPPVQAHLLIASEAPTHDVNYIINAPTPQHAWWDLSLLLITLQSHDPWVGNVHRETCARRKTARAWSRRGIIR